MRDMEHWCRYHLISRLEIGKTVFSTRVHHEHRLMGRKGAWQVVYGLPDDYRDFAEYLVNRERIMIRLVEHLNRLDAATRE